MSTKFFTNRDNNTLLAKFEGVFHNLENIHCFDALVGYFRASGYFKIRQFLEKIPKIRILVGINVDSLVQKYHSKSMEYRGKPEDVKTDFFKSAQEDIQNAEYNKDIEHGILQFIDDIISEKIEIRAHPTKKIHAKIYIFRPENFNMYTHAEVISGSSNLTEQGLGTGNYFNYEFNVALRDYEDVKFATNEFELLWKESISILPTDASNIKKDTHLDTHYTPFELYIKFLIEYFGENIDYNPDTVGDLPEKFKKLSYQIDAVNEGYQKIIQHNGFFLADVVGLGKTLVAAMIAKRFILENGKGTRILIVYPPALEKTWMRHFKELKIDSYTQYISNGSLHKILEGDNHYWDKGEYDLIIIDEAHRYRNHTSQMFQAMQQITKAPRLNKGGISGQKKKVILISATPLNNKPEDIYNQLLLFQDSRNSTLPIQNLQSFFYPLSQKYKEIRNSENVDFESLKDIFKIIRNKIIEPITIRRTRKDIESIPAYKKDILEQGVKFPEIVPPISLEYILIQKLNKLFYETVFTLTDRLGYYRYQIVYYLKPEIRNKFYPDLPEKGSEQLARIMKLFLIKRLESSFFAFKKSIERFDKAMENIENMFKNDRVFIAPDLDLNKLIAEGREDEIEEIIFKKLEENPDSKNRVFLSSDFLDDYLKDIQKDKAIIQKLNKDWSEIKVDPKMDKFIESIQTTFLQPNINPTGKLVIFSESKETTDEIKRVLETKGISKILAVDSKNRKDRMSDIMDNFDANVDKEKQKDEYDILISTEVMSEGINLHRANVIINYDTPWNSTKLMQRIGRVNRIGTIADKIYIYNFKPSAQGNDEIKLNQAALRKLQSFHYAFGEDSQIYTDEEVLDDDQIKLFHAGISESKDEKLKYLHFLRDFKKNHPEWFKKIKKLPDKCRLARNSQTEKNSTITYLKSENRTDYLLIQANEQIESLNFLEAVRLFEASEKEEKQNIKDWHYDHIYLALQRFGRDLKKETESESEKVLKTGMAGNVRTSISFVNTFLASAPLKPTEAETLKRLANTLNKGTYTQLPNEVGKIEKKVKSGSLKIELALKQLIELSQKFSQSETSFSTDSEKEVLETEAEKPSVILAESFQ